MFDGMSKTVETDEAQQSFDSLKARLAGVTAPHKPNADPHSAAVTALLATDYLEHADLKGKVEGNSDLSTESLAELRALSRAILHCLEQLGGDWFPLEGKAPLLGSLHEEGVAQRDALVKLLDSEVKDAQVLAIVDSIKKGDGDVDLILDLRALAALAEQHASSSKEAKDAAEKALALSDKADAKLSEGEPKERAEWRENVVRAWTLFAPKYEHVCAAARKVTGEGVDSTKFPPLYTVSRARRTRKRGSVTPPPESLRAAAMSATADPFKVDLPPASIEGSGAPSRRTNPRYAVEMEVGIGSESNFYVGFTENLSAQGVFIATYSPKKMGSHVDVTLNLPTGAQLIVPGTVKWIRNSSPSGDTWPGMGVQFDKLSDEQEKQIRDFIRVRDPLFFDDD
jgi:uncharacterized protein (TIGR02266 family)